MAIVNRRMKVMHIISGDLWAGAEVQAYTLVNALAKECDIAVMVMNPGELADRLHAAGIQVIILDESKLNSLQIVTGLRRQLRKFAPDLIHTHRQKENILGNLANLLSVRAKSVRTSHGAPEFNAKGLRQIQPWLDNWVGRHHQAAVISVSADLANKLAIIFPKEKIRVINNGVDIQALKTAATDADFRQQAPTAKHIGIVGRLEPVKRVDIFLEMAALLVKQPECDDYQFHVIGDGKLRAALESSANQLGLGQRVHFHGHRKDMAACISSLDAIVMCSDHEGTPMTALEAMALGTPLVAHNVGGLAEVLSAYPALQVTEHTPIGYAKTVKKILQASEAYSVDLAHCYTSEQNAAATISLYRELLQ